jgi:hypothetical protein
MANKLILFLALFCVSGFARIDVALIKEAGNVTVLEAIDAKSAAAYPGKHLGSSAHFGAASNKLAVHLEDGESPTLAEAILAAIEKPTVSAASLTITSNFGTYIVADDTVITADPTEVKFVKIVLSLDGGNDFQIEALEKTTGAYGTPTGSSPIDLKEFSVQAAGSTLTEVQNFIK